jgi:hypothetical protein
MTVEEWTEAAFRLREAAARVDRLEEILEGREVPLPTLEERPAMFWSGSARP